MGNKENINVENSEEDEKILKPKKSKKIWLWIISVFCTMYGVMFIKDITIPAILILFAGIISLPPVDEIIKEKLNDTTKRKIFSAIRTIYIIIAIMIVGTANQNSTANGTDNTIINTSNKISPVNVEKNINEIDQNTIIETITNIINTENGRYDGDIVNGKMYGNGTYEWNDGTKYTGEFSNNQINGKGTLEIPEKGSYEGEFKNGKKNGQGTYKFANGDTYVGNWSEDKMTGQGTYTFSNGEKYVGEFKDNEFNGKGTYSKDGKDYTGTWKDNKYTK